MHFIVLMHPGREITANYGKTMHPRGFLESGKTSGGNQMYLALFAYSLTPEGKATRGRKCKCNAHYSATLTLASQKETREKW